jgi:3-hydroxyacyl-[acyl-carrier-protein] dehydratase
MSMNFEEIKGVLKQRFPFIMVDRVLEIEPGKRIKALKNVTGNEIQFLGHFPECAIMPGVFIVEAIGQSASILFSSTTKKGIDKGEAMVLGVINNMRFLAPVYPGQTMFIEVNVIKMVEEAALVEGTVTVEGNVVAMGKLSFVRKML